MPAPSSFSEQVLAVPSAPGGVQGLGETFAADPYTGTGRYRIPISVPSAFNGVRPELALVYSSGAGNGVCGLGWSFSPGSVRRRLEKGIPRYTPDDRFALGDDELVPAGGDFFALRTEGTFARIRHVLAPGEDFWAVTDRSGVRRLYGRAASARDGEAGRVTAWQLTQVCDADGHSVDYTWVADAGGRRSYLAQVDWGAGAYRAILSYEDRPDVIRTARGGFAQSTGRRLSGIAIQVRRSSTGVFTTFDAYALAYDQGPASGLSRLVAVSRTTTAEDGSSQAWPVLALRYAEPAIQGAVLTVPMHPSGSLASGDVALVDLDGDGLVDVVESRSSGWRLWRNDGEGSFLRPVPIPGPAAGLSDPGVFLADFFGEGLADLLTPTGCYPNGGDGFEAFHRFGARPSFALEDADTRFLDLDGDGVGDVLVTGEGGLTRYLLTPGEGFASAPARSAYPAGGDFPRFSDRHARVADMDGDGLADVVYLDRGGVTVWTNLGHGRFAAPRRLPLPEALPREVEPEHMHLLDVTGTGAADLVVRRTGEFWIFPNGCGSSFGAKHRLACRSARAEAALEAVDLRGTGVRGLLLTDAAAWTYHELWNGERPDALSGVDNGMGASTTIEYGSSVAHARRDRARGDRWQWPLPLAIRVVDAVTTTDAVTATTISRRYRYHHGYHDAREREFRGFARVEECDTAAGSAETPTRTVRFYDVGNGERLPRDYACVPASIPVDSVPDHPAARRALRGMLVREEVYGDDGSALARVPYLVTHHGYTVTGVRGPPAGSPGRSFFPARTATLSAHTERDASDPRLALATTAYDGYGRVTEARTVASGRPGTFTSAHEQQQAEDIERWTSTAYVELDAPETDDYDAAYVPVYLVDRPAVVETWGLVSGTATLLGRQRHYYDGTAYVGLGYPGSGTTAGVTRGRLSCTVALAFDDALLAAVYDSSWGVAAALADRGGYLADGTEYYVHAARFQHDATTGMKTGSRDARGNTSTASYDATHGFFPVGAVDAAGHPTTVTRGDFPFQVSEVLDANGNTTILAWDSSGMLASRAVKGKYVGGAWQGDPDIAPTETYAYDLASVPVSVTVATRQVRLGATRDVTRYLDGLGRVVQERHTAEPDPSTSAARVRVTGAVVYNEKGLVVRAYQPTFGSGTAFVAPDTSVPRVETTYDALGRPVRVDYPDGTFETTTWHPWVRETADRNDNASGIGSADPRYGGILAYFAPHLGTPLKTYLDAAGREIAVAEDLGGGTLHVTRTVLDLRDQPTEVWDARGLSSATWTFTVDSLGRRLASDHPTALGARAALPDAANNPIWSRTARGIEVDRTFDALNRPLAESSDDGTGAKLRRAWRYVAYDETDPAFADWQDKNVFGKVEEERDADGLRFFEYDWRGLVTRASHRFWPQADGSARPWTSTASDLWTTGTAWDPGVDDTDRDSITGWLELPGLADTTTATITTTYDAAGHPLVSSYPEGLALRRGYNEAGTLSLLESDDGGGYATVVEDVTYNARGQCTGWTHGNGVVTEREYDADTERLVSLFTSLPGSSRVDFQDLDYVYDPAGNPSQLTDNLATSTYAANQIVPNTRTFRYDARYRLARATGRKHNSASNWWDDPLVGAPSPGDYAAYDFTYAYDAAGNLSRNDEFGATTLYYKATRVDLYNGDASEATSTAPALGNWRYDANGNCVHTPRHDTLGYTFDDQLAYADLGGGGQVRYGRHGDHRVVRMVQKTGVTALGIYLGPFEYHWRDGTTAYTKVVLHAEGPGGKHAQVEAVIAGSDPDSLAIFHVHGDHLGSGHVLTSASGDLLSQEEFLAYGRASDRRDARNRYRYIGVERDEDTGLSMTGPRTYMPGIGRFLQGDPIAAKFAGWAPFAYGGGNPVARSDPSGYEDEPSGGDGSLGAAPAASALRDPFAVPKGWLTTGATVASIRKDGLRASNYAAVAPADRVVLGAEVRLDGETRRLDFGEYPDVVASAPDDANDCLDYADRLLDRLGVELVQTSSRLQRSSRYSDTGTSEVRLPGSVAPSSEAENRSRLDFIDRRLLRHRPVVVGVSYTEGSRGDNLDGATDHWIAVFGRDYDADGAVFYWGVGSIHDEVVKLYVDPRDYGLFSRGARFEFGGRAAGPYHGTNAREVEAPR